MGFSSTDDWINKITNGNIFRIDWMRQTTAVGAYTAGRWYDMSQTPGYPTQNSWGELVKYGDFFGSATGWTLGAGWAYGTNNVTHTAGGGATAISQTIPIVNGRTYRTSYTSSGLGGAGNFRIKIGGTAGTDRNTASTFVENIIAGASGIIEIDSDNARTVTIDDISVIEPLAFTPYNDSSIGALYHGGNVSPSTKHLQNAGVVSATATAVPGVWVLVDILGCYPRIDMNSAVLQTLNNGLSLPRYATGEGVRAFLTPTTALGAVAHNIAISYTNTVPTSGRTLPVTVAGTSSGTLGQIDHSGVNANNYGPFLPLAAGDYGISKVDSITLSAGTGASQLASLVLCKDLAWIPVTTASVLTEREFWNQFGSLPRIYDGAYLSWLFFAGAALAASSNICGYLDVTWG